eukprot:TRINITY_DN102059_c0_g1_i1.p1 TRINITY_DN102059_c0_g1~~TRINITY_DN102059_c0_g1_i1.p1  ORF type:complete len:121 (-),score=32.21 TRINITY_DN102059_c0_g1_i1:110-430(-)
MQEASDFPFDPPSRVVDDSGEASPKTGEKALECTKECFADEQSVTPGSSCEAPVAERQQEAVHADVRQPQHMPASSLKQMGRTELQQDFLLMQQLQAGGTPLLMMI